MILGIGINLVGTWRDQVEVLQGKIRQAAKRVRASKASVSIKVKAILASILAGIDYKSGLSVWSEADLTKLSNQLFQMIRQSLAMHNTYPVVLLHNRTGGLALPSLLERTIQTKYRVARRVMYGPAP